MDDGPQGLLAFISVLISVAGTDVVFVIPSARADLSVAPNCSYLMFV
jgi:hypothetical protein